MLLQSINRRGEDSDDDIVSETSETSEGRTVPSNYSTPFSSPAAQTAVTSAPTSQTSKEAPHDSLEVDVGDASDGWHYQGTLSSSSSSSNNNNSNNGRVSSVSIATSENENSFAAVQTSTKSKPAMGLPAHLRPPSIDTAPADLDPAMGVLTGAGGDETAKKLIDMLRNLKSSPSHMMMGNSFDQPTTAKSATRKSKRGNALTVFRHFD
jgi:hypothetical protein